MTIVGAVEGASSPSVVARPESRTALVAMLVAVFGLSAGTTMIKSTGLPGPVTGFWRLLFGAIGWQVFLASRRRKFTRDALRATMVPGLLFGANLTFFFSGVTRTAIAHAEFMGVLTPLIVIPIASYQLRERVPRGVLAYGALAVSGVVMIVAFSARKGGNASLTGDLMVLCGIFLWSGYLLRGKQVRASFDTATFMAGMSSWAALLVFPFALVSHRITTATTKGWILIVVMAITSGMISHGLLSYAQQHVPLGVIALLQLGQPPLGALWGRLFLHETVRPLQIVGMGLVLSAVSGVAVSSARTTQKSRT